MITDIKDLSLQSSHMRLMSNALDTQTEHTSFLLPGIVVLNYNYFPDSAYSAQCCNWSGSLIGWLVGKAPKSQPVRSFDWLPAGWF